MTSQAERLPNRTGYRENWNATAQRRLGGRQRPAATPRTGYDDRRDEICDEAISHQFRRAWRSEPIVSSQNSCQITDITGPEQQDGAPRRGSIVPSGPRRTASALVHWLIAYAQNYRLAMVLPLSTAGVLGSQ